MNDLRATGNRMSHCTVGSESSSEERREGLSLRGQRAWGRGRPDACKMVTLLIGVLVYAPLTSAQSAPRGHATRSARSSTDGITGGERVAADADRAPPPTEVPGLSWGPHLRRFSVAEGVFSGLMASAAIATYLVPTHDAPAWRGGIGADDATRASLALRTHADRSRAATASDALLFGLAAVPVVMDAILTAWVGGGSSDVAAQMLLIDVQAYAFSQGLTGIFKWAVGRERPVARGCRESAERRADDPTCEGQESPNIAPHSFFSGHTSVAFTSAALVCLHHTELSLFGEAGDAAACATSLTFASAVGVLRMMADLHYLSDVVIGAGVGLVSGWLLPYVLHYAQFGGGPESHFRAAIAPSFDRELLGLQVVGQF